jgi:hypothetical protein
MGDGILGYLLPVLLPITSAVTIAIAAVHHGPVRVYWSIATVAAIGASATLSVIKERRSKSVDKTTEQVKAELATKLADMGNALLTLLSDVTSTTKIDEATAAIKVLIDRSVSLAQNQLGNQTNIKCHVRAAYYQFDDGNKNLVRNNYHTSAGDKPPRPRFVGGGSDHDDDVIRLALGEDVRFVRDLENELLPYSPDSGTRPYKTLISVPVRVGNSSYGLLTADSDVTYSLTSADKGFLILFAGTLAAGLAHLEAVRGAAQS